MRCLWEISIRSALRETCQRPLRNFSKEMTFCDVFKTSQKDLKIGVFCVTSLRRLEHISKKMSFPWRLWDVSKTSLASICDFSKVHHKNGFVWFRRVITISNKKDVGPLETLKKWNVFWEQCIDINQVYHEYQWADICVRVSVSQRLS